MLTARAATDINQNLIWRWHSDAFGVGEAESFVDGSAQELTLNLRFPGQYYDQESGLHYNYFRTYDPSMGRYTQSDPIGLMGGMNTFAYVGGSPLLAMDPLGLFQASGKFKAPAPGTDLYKALLRAGVISQVDGPAPFIGDVAAVSYLAGFLAAMAVDSMLDHGPVLPERSDFDYLANEINLYTGVIPQIDAMTWASYNDLVDELNSAQRAYVAANQNSCSSDYDPALLASAESFIQFNATLNSIIGTSQVERIAQQQYEDYRANGGDLLLSFQDWVAVGMPQADAVGSKEAGIGTRFADQEKLADHFARHGSDFGAKTALEYQAQADKFLTASKHSGILEKTRANGDIVRYNPTTDEFGVLSSGGSIRTYYKPDPTIHGKSSNLEYYNAQ